MPFKSFESSQEQISFSDVASQSQSWWMDACQMLHMSSIADGIPQIQIKRATVKVRQGKIYVGKLPTEVTRIFSFFQKKNLVSDPYPTDDVFFRGAQKMIFAHILSSLALLWRYFANLRG